MSGNAAKMKGACAVNCVHFIDGTKNQAFVVNGFLYFNVTRRSNSVQKFKKNIILFIQLFPVLWQGTKLYIEQDLHHIYWTSSVSSVLHFLLLYQSKLSSCTSRLKYQRGRTRNSEPLHEHSPPEQSQTQELGQLLHKSAQFVPWGPLADPRDVAARNRAPGESDKKDYLSWIALCTVG